MKKLLLALGTLPAIAASAADAIPKHLDATLPDAAAVGGLSQCFAVVAAGAGGFGRVAVVVEIPGLFVAGGVVQRDGRRLFGVEDVFRQGGGDARRGGECVHGDFGFFGLFCGGLRVQRGFGVNDGGGEAEGEQDDGIWIMTGSP